jgi:hypothetical protein
MRFAFARRTPPFDRLLFFLSRWTPKLSEVLVIESGSRRAAARFLSDLYKTGETRRLDVLTCYRTPPEPFDASRGRVFYTHQAQAGPERAELFRSLTRSGYSALCVLCTGDNIMTKWKWAAAVRIPAKVMIVNENADCFWLDRGHLRNIRDMMLERSGVRRMTPLRMVGQALAFPFTLLILLAYGGYMQTRRLLREL